MSTKIFHLRGGGGQAQGPPPKYAPLLLAEITTDGWTRSTGYSGSISTDTRLFVPWTIRTLDCSYRGLSTMRGTNSPGAHSTAIVPPPYRLYLDQVTDKIDI